MKQISKRVFALLLKMDVLNILPLALGNSWCVRRNTYRFITYKCKVLHTFKHLKSFHEDRERTKVSYWYYFKYFLTMEVMREMKMSLWSRSYCSVYMCIHWATNQAGLHKLSVDVWFRWSSKTHKSEIL